MQRTDELEVIGLEQHEIGSLFEAIAPSYDKVNRLLSCGCDLYWRKKLSRLLLHTFHHSTPLSLLDLATGTGDQLAALIKEAPSVKEAVGVDLSDAMLEIARRKLNDWSLLNRDDGNDVIRFQKGESSQLPFPDNSFDLITISFGIRNILERSRTLQESARLLRSGGRVGLLECSLPSNTMIRSLYRCYLHRLLPRIGGWCSGNRAAYDYLSHSVEAFLSPDELLSKMDEAGLTELRRYPLTLGVVTCYLGTKR